MGRRDLAARLAGLLEGAPEPTLVVGEDGLIRLANARACDLFGYPMEEFVGLEIESLLPSAAREAHRRARLAYHRAPQDRSMGRGLQIVARRRDGTEFRADVELRSRRDEHGVMTLAVIRDLTRLELEAGARRAVELERCLELTRLAAEDLGELLAQVELRLQRVAAAPAEAVRLGASLDQARGSVALARDVAERILGYAREVSGGPDAGGAP